MNGVKEKLRELGFSEKEATVYLTLLGVGAAVASDIAKRAGLKRSTAYVILESLAEKGLVSAVDRRGVRLYHAAPAEQLVQYMRNMASRYEGFVDVAKVLSQKLKAPRAASTPAPKVQIFQGMDAVKSVYEDVLASLGEIRVHADFAHTKAGRKNLAEKGEHNIKIRKIFFAASGDRTAVAPDQEGLRKILLHSRGQDGFSSEMNIYDDRVVFISPSENFALIAESKEFANALKKICDAPERRQRAVHAKESEYGLGAASEDHGLAVA